MTAAARSSLSRGMTTTPHETMSRTPSHRAHEPSVRFSGIAMMSRSSSVSCRHTLSARSALETPTTMKTGSSCGRGGFGVGRR